jgi:hypothetical protein
MKGGMNLRPQRKSGVRACLLSAVLTLAIPVLALELPETAALVSDDLSCALLKKEFIRAETKGTVPVSIHAAISVLQQPSFLTRVQEEYEKLLPAGKRPDFIVQQSTANTWFYINKKQERTDITEVAGRMNGADTFDLAYYTQGDRFFGAYEALIHIRLTGTGNSTDYTVAVYAYPGNGFSRFFARHLQLVERYFRSKTGEISELAVRISTRLCNDEALSHGRNPPKDDFLSSAF